MIRNMLKALRNRFSKRTLFPIYTNKLLHISTFSARLKIKKKQRLRILIDNSVIAHSVTHEDAWIDTDYDKELKMNFGYRARVPVHSANYDSKEKRSIDYLAGIYYLAEKGYLDIFISNELQDEQLTQPGSRYSDNGNGLFGYSLIKIMKNNPIKLLNNPNYRLTIGRHFPSIKEQREKRLSAVNDKTYLGLLVALGKRNSQDAYHIYTAESNNIYCFLTMDFKLIKAIQSQNGHPAIKSLKTKIISPEELGKELSLVKLPPIMFSYHDSSFFVEPSMNLIGSKRSKAKKQASSQNPS